jgi:lysophospholipase L1-like esterase
VLRYLALGDSYTIGEGVPDSGRWPAQLVEALRARGVRIDDPQIIARTGWTTDELDAAIEQAAPAGTFDLVTLLIGVNDQYRGRTAEAYREQFRKLLDRAIAFAGGVASHVVVVSIPDWGVTRFAGGRDRAAIAKAIDAFNAVNRDEAKKAGPRYVDVTPASREAGSQPEFLVDDGLHPSAEAYSRWTQLILPAAIP